MDSCGALSVGGANAGAAGCVAKVTPVAPYMAELVGGTGVVNGGGDGDERDAFL